MYKSRVAYDDDDDCGRLVKRQGGKHRPATDAISDAAADVDDYHHHFDDEDAHDDDDGDGNDKYDDCADDDLISSFGSK